MATVAGPRALTARSIICAAAVAAAALASASCGGSDDDRTDGAAQARPDLQRLLVGLRSAGAPGVVALVRNRSGTWRGTTGAAVVEPRRPMKPGDRFRVGSITKTFVATAVLQLVADGRLQLDDTVERRLPGVLRAGGRITVHQLLNHTSGLVNYDETAAAEVVYRRFLADLHVDIPVRGAIASADAQPLRFRPGSGHAYTNTGYEVLGLIVERAAGKPLARVLEERIFEPLKLPDTSFDIRPPGGADLAHGYAVPGGDLPVWEPRDVTAASMLGKAASGAVVSTADDLATFYRALFTGRLVPRPLLAAVQTTVPAGRGERAGLGVFRYRLACGYGWGHGGATLGYSAVVITSKDGSHTAVVAVNSYTVEIIRALTQAARAAYCAS